MIPYNVRMEISKWIQEYPDNVIISIRLSNKVYKIDLWIKLLQTALKYKVSFKELKDYYLGD